MLVLSLGDGTGKNGSQIWHMLSSLGMQCSKEVFFIRFPDDFVAEVLGTKGGNQINRDMGSFNIYNV